MVADSRSRPSAISPLRKRWNPNKGDRIILLVNVSVPRCPSSVRVAQPCVWCLSPFVCGYVVYILGIQNVFFVTAGCGLLNQALAYITFPETLELERRRPSHLARGNPASKRPVFMHSAQLRGWRTRVSSPVHGARCRRRCGARQFIKGEVAHTGVSSPQQLRRASGQRRIFILIALSMIEMLDVLHLFNGPGATHWTKGHTVCCGSVSHTGPRVT